MYTTGNATCDAMAELRLQGNIIPMMWHKTIVSAKTGKADLLAINIMADVAYWYRPVEVRNELTGAIVGYRKKFAADLLQCSYDKFAERFGVSKGQIKTAVLHLEELGVIHREFRTIVVNGMKVSNVLFLGLDVDRLRELTYPSNNTSGEKGTEGSDQFDGGVLKKQDTCTENTPSPMPEDLQTNTETTKEISLEIPSEITQSFGDVMDGVSVSAENVQSYLDIHHELSADWANQPRIMRKAIETAVEWDFRQDNGFSYAKDELERRQMATLSLTVSVLTEMCCAAKPWSYQGMAVDRIMALERINGVLRAEQGSLAPFVEDFIDIFIGTADANHPSNSKGYMRALLWDHLARYLVEQENL